MTRIKKIKGLKEKVLTILEKYPETRNSDIKLTNAIWFEYYKEFLVALPNGEAGVSLLNIYELPHQDNIKRLRAHIQNKKKMFLPTSLEVAKQRKWLEEDWRSHLGYCPELRTI